LAALALAEFERFDSEAVAKKNVRAAIEVLCSDVAAADLAQVGVDVA
jgi:hypothetical protein